jgi:RimJ/RimL family protein N-acetyltransferase
MIKIPTLETERLLLRPFVIEDAPDVQRLAGDRAIADTTLNIPHPYEDGVAEDWISTHQEAFAKNQGVTFAVTRKPNGSLVGAISLMDIIKGHKAELGYWIAKPYWSQGLCTEAGHAILRYAFTELGLGRLHAGHISRNPASGQVMLKLGMQHEGTQRQHVRRWGLSDNLELYGIMKEEWDETPSGGIQI